MLPVNLSSLGGQIIRGIPYSDALDLTANTAKSYAVPSGVTHIVFDYTAPFTDAVWVNAFGSTASIPSSDLVGGKNAFKIFPGVAYSVSSETVLSIVSSANKVLSIQGYSATAI